MVLKHLGLGSQVLDKQQLKHMFNAVFGNMLTNMTAVGYLQGMSDTKRDTTIK